MKIFKILVLVFISIGVISFANTTFSKAASGKVELTQKGEGKEYCPICGMNINHNYKTSHAAHTKEGIDTQYCSLRCLIVDHLENDTNLSKARVVDAKTEKLIFAKNAHYVVGSKAPGTMSKVSKYAFKEKKDALEFIKLLGGELKTFDEAYEIAKKSLEKDIAMTNAKRAKMIYPMGKKLYLAKCDKTKMNLSGYSRINTLKSDVAKYCENVKPKQVQAISLYLWDVKRFEKQTMEKIVVGKDERCPVCAMFVYKYPRWAAQTFYQHDDHEHHFSFDGIKDMVKYLKNPTKYGGKADFKPTKILATDYYSQLAINARDAFYVLGSDVYGPMGEELIPFASKNDAKAFLKDHKAKAILTFEEILSPKACEYLKEICK